MNFTQIKPRILSPRIPELGQIKIGGKGEERTSKKGGKYRLPVKYDHFVITQRTRDAKTENLVRDEAIHEKIGAKPTELDVRLLFDRPEQNFQYFLAAYEGRKRRCIGNGETAEDSLAGAIGCTCPWFKSHEGEWKGPARPINKSSPVCKPHGRLSVILEAAETFGGFYTFRTTSWETISSIASQMDLYVQQFGFLAGLPLRMVLYPTTDQYEENDTLKTSISYKVALVLRGSFDTARQLAASAYERREMLALPSPQQAERHAEQLREIEERDVADIADEFHPQAPPEVFVEGPVVDADVLSEEEAEEEQYREDLCRMTLEAADWQPERINAQIAKYSADLSTLVDVLREKMPKQVVMAEERLAPAADEEPESVPAGATSEQTDLL